MAVAWASTGSVVTGSGASPVLNPVGTAGDSDSRHLLFITWKSITTEPVVTSTGTQWTKLHTKLNTSGVSTAADVGATHTSVYFADGTCPTSNNVTFTGTIGCAQAVVVRFSKASTEYYQMSYGSAQMNATSQPTFTTTQSMHVRGITGGVVAVAVGLNTDAGTLTAATSSAASGGTLTNRLTSQSATGDDTGFFVWTASNVAGDTTTTRTMSATIGSTAYNASMIMVSLTANYITWGGSGGGAVGTAGAGNPAMSVPTASPTGIGYRNFLFVAWKPSSNTIEPVITSTTGEWRRLTASSNGLPVASGVDTGSMRSVLYYADGSSPTGTLAAFTGTIGSAIGLCFSMHNGDSTFGSLSTFATTGTDESNGANYSATSVGDLDLGVNDILMTFTGINSDATTATVQTATTANRTIGVSSSNHNDNTASGDDSGVHISAFPVVLAQTGEDGVITYTHTNASSTQGTTIFVRLRRLPNPVINATPVNQFYRNPGYTVSIAENLSLYDYFEIIRSDETGLPDAHIRGGQYQPVTSDAFSTEDYEFRFGSTGYGLNNNILTYTGNFYSGGQLVYTVFDEVTGLTDWIASVDDTFSGNFPDQALPKTWISVPDIPSLNIPVNVGNFQEASFEGNILSTSHVLGRRNPVVATDVTSGMKGNFSLVLAYITGITTSTGIPYNIEDYTDFLSTGAVFKLRNLAPIIVGFEDFYFVVESYSIKRTNWSVNQQIMVDRGRANTPGALSGEFYSPMTITVNFVEVDAPPNGVPPSQFTWQTLPDTFNSWNDINVVFPNWLAVLQTTDGDFE